MIKKQSIHLSQYEVLEITNLKEADFDHERTEQSPTGIKAILRGFYDQERNKVETKEVANRVIRHLREQGIITGEKKWRYNFTAKHGWSGYDDDGYAHSIYSFEFETYLSERIAD